MRAAKPGSENCRKKTAIALFLASIKIDVAFQKKSASS
jgi:hypothetical protein